MVRHRRVTKWCAAFLLCACAAPAAPTIHVTCPPPREEPCERRTFERSASPRDEAPEEALAAPPREAPPWTLASRREDLDGDGDLELIEIFSDGSVHADGAVGYLRLAHRPDGPDQEWGATLEVIDVRRGDRHCELLIVEPGFYESPHHAYTILSLRGDALYSSETMSVPLDASDAGEPPRPILRGDGTILLRFEHCEGHFVHRAIEHRLLTDGSIREVRDHTDHTDRHCELAACPYVFVDGRLAGEILRDLVGASAETEQTLELPNAIASDGTLTVVLRELKPEITYLDSIHLVADGRVVAPRECGRACASDHRYETLAIGDERTYVFDVGSASRLTLVARGYYEPFLSP
jgi:hypothetical protein